MAGFYKETEGAEIKGCVSIMTPLTCPHCHGTLAPIDEGYDDEEELPWTTYECAECGYVGTIFKAA